MCHLCFKCLLCKFIILFKFLFFTLHYCCHLGQVSKRFKFGVSASIRWGQEAQRNQPWEISRLSSHSYACRMRYTQSGNQKQTLHFPHCNGSLFYNLGYAHGQLLQGLWIDSIDDLYLAQNRWCQVDRSGISTLSLQRRIEILVGPSLWQDRI